MTEKRSADSSFHNLDILETKERRKWYVRVVWRWTLKSVCQTISLLLFRELLMLIVPRKSHGTRRCTRTSLFCMMSKEWWKTLSPYMGIIYIYKVWSDLEHIELVWVWWRKTLTSAEEKTKLVCSRGHKRAYILGPVQVRSKVLPTSSMSLFWRMVPSVTIESDLLGFLRIVCTV